MTGKLRLEDLRVFRDWVIDRNGHVIITQSFTPASIADWVEVGRQLGAEQTEVSEREVKWVDDEGEHHSVIVGTPIIAHAGPGTYLLFRLPVESPTPKEEEQ